jgi:hypothetical protein
MAATETILNSVLQQLAALSSSEEILGLRPTPALQERIDALLEKNRTIGFSPDDQREWDQIERVEHLVRFAKANALPKLREAGLWAGPT